MLVTVAVCMVFAANQRKVKASFTASATHASTRRRRRAKPPRSSPNALLSEEFCSKARPRRARQLLRERPGSDSLLVRSLTFSSFGPKGVVQRDIAPVRLWQHSDRNGQEGEVEAGDGGSKWWAEIGELPRGYTSNNHFPCCKS